jgi:hypothetical protein
MQMQHAAAAGFSNYEQHGFMRAFQTAAWARLGALWRERGRWGVEGRSPRTLAAIAHLPAAVIGRSQDPSVADRLVPCPRLPGLTVMLHWLVRFPDRTSTTGCGPPC